jgi:hypothetical protein
MKINDLLIKPNLLLRANRTPWKDKPRPQSSMNGGEST